MVQKRAPKTGKNMKRDERKLTLLQWKHKVNIYQVEMKKGRRMKMKVKVRKRVEKEVQKDK